MAPPPPRPTPPGALGRRCGWAARPCSPRLAGSVVESGTMKLREGHARRAPKTTTHGIVARDAEVAIVLRRGPTRRVRLLRWNLRDDTVQGGQWLEGTVTSGACAVSPSGELFVYFARKAGRTFTCVSRPPYFTALAFWASELPWTGGGFFAEDDHIVLGLTHAPDEGALPPDQDVSASAVFVEPQAVGRRKWRIWDRSNGWTGRKTGRSSSETAVVSFDDGCAAAVPARPPRASSRI